MGLRQNCCLNLIQIKSLLGSYTGCPVNNKSLLQILFKYSRLRYITVNNGDISAFILFSQVKGVSLLGGHDCTTFIGAVQVAFVPQLRAMDSQSLREGEWLSGSVCTVRLIHPLHHRRFDGVGAVLALQHHRGKQHGKLLIFLYCHMNTVASQPWKKMEKWGQIIWHLIHKFRWQQTGQR